MSTFCIEIQKIDVFTVHKVTDTDFSDNISGFLMRSFRNVYNGQGVWCAYRTFVRVKIMISGHNSQ